MISPVKFSPSMVPAQPKTRPQQPIKFQGDLTPVDVERLGKRVKKLLIAATIGLVSVGALIGAGVTIAVKHFTNPAMPQTAPLNPPSEKPNN